MLSSLDCILFRRQAKTVVAHGVQNIVPLVSLISSVNVACDIAQRVAYVQTSARRIRKHVQYIIFFSRGVFDDFVSIRLLPLRFPALLNCLKIVFHTVAEFAAKVVDGCGIFTACICGRLPPL